MKRKCNCSGSCGSVDPNLTRREFLSVISAGTTATLLTGPDWSALGQLSPEALAAWKRNLLQPGEPRVYRSDRHTDARLHLGGIGTGNFEIGADGQFTTWQLFHTLRDGLVPFYFAIKVGEYVRLLQTAGGPEWPRVKRIDMTGEYPFATLKFLDPDSPVQLELSAFSPFAPLDTALSSTPLAAFVFRVTNPSHEERMVSLGAFFLNPIGYDAAGTIKDFAHPNFGGNINVPFQTPGAAGLEMRANPASAPTLDRAVAIFALPSSRGILTPPSDRPANLGVSLLDHEIKPESLADPQHTVLWLEEAPEDLAAPLLRSAGKAVEAGATLVFAGSQLPLLGAFARLTAGKPLTAANTRPDILFEDFEGGYDKWTVEGTAFGERPAGGTLPNQQRVSGFLGKGLVNTYLGGDDSTGRMTSKPFKVERRFIRFLVGGGSQARTQIRLAIDGKIVRATAGHDNERLLPASWNVQEFEGQSAHLEIVDEQKGGWGHINIDQIEFSDQPADSATMQLLDQLLPARFSNVRPLPNAATTAPNVLELENCSLKPDAVWSTAANGLLLLSRPLGKGKVVLATGAILRPPEAELWGARQRAYELLCALVDARYATSNGVPPKAPGSGTVALATLGPEPSVATALSDWSSAWSTFASQGQFTHVTDARTSEPSPAGRSSGGALTSTVRVPAGQTVEVPFLLAWHYSNKYNGDGVWMGCHYATTWPDARAVVRAAVEQLSAARQKTELFRQTLYASTLPYWLLDCLTSQAATIRHIGVVFRIANGDTYGWEGSNGCCQPTCTHVWGYEQSLARLFPDLERDMRRIDFKHQQRPDGGVNNRTDVPSPARPTGEQPFADGHASCILKAYREALNQPSETGFTEYWPHVKKAVEYLIGRDAAAAQGEPEGVLRDDQWNTYDEALHGVTTFIGTYYLAALRAGEAWARRVGDSTTADRFHSLFEKGQRKLIELCWNGEYFQQHLPDYLQRSGEVGPGCMSDQLLGQWWAHQLGLGYVLPKEMVQTALRSVFKYNWMPDLTGWKHSPRAFAGACDKGLIICTWPKGGRPANVMLYSDEVWTGIEYQVAAHLIYEGMIEEGLAIVKGARDRYDGVPRPPIARNPWNEIECGGHYARAMSSWSLLLALSGYEYDGPAKRLRFTPRIASDHFQAFYCGPDGWGTLRQTRQPATQTNEIIVADGRFDLRQLRLSSARDVHQLKVTLGGNDLRAAFQPAPDGLIEISLSDTLTLRPGAPLTISMS